ncbi:hypothetical protein LINGRAPRIM_LOCUS977 [Linum grandiflorum]
MDSTPRLPVLLPHLPLRLLLTLHRRRRLHRRLALHFQARLLLLHLFRHPQGPQTTLHHLRLRRPPHARLQHCLPHLPRHLHSRHRHSEPSTCDLLPHRHLRLVSRRPRLHHCLMAHGQRCFRPRAYLRIRRHEEELRAAQGENPSCCCAGVWLLGNLRSDFWDLWGCGGSRWS